MNSEGQYTNIQLGLTACHDGRCSRVQAKKGSFSAYAYEVLPLMHTLLGKNTIEAETLSADTVAFLDGYKGHISPVMQDLLANSKEGLSGGDAASSRGNANSLVKVSLALTIAHPIRRQPHAYSCSFTVALS